MDEEKNSVSFRFPSPPHRLSFFAPSAKSPRNSSRQTCRRTTKEILSHRRASVPSATGRRVEKKAIVGRILAWGSASPQLWRPNRRTRSVPTFLPHRVRVANFALPLEVSAKARTPLARDRWIVYARHVRCPETPCKPSAGSSNPAEGYGML